MSGLKWCLYPENTPDEVGYYYTFYHNLDEKAVFYKSIWWNGKKWCPWRPNGSPSLIVIQYAPQTKAPFYTESLKKVSELENE